MTKPISFVVTHEQSIDCYSLIILWFFKLVLVVDRTFGFVASLDIFFNIVSVGVKVGSWHDLPSN